MSFRRSRAFGTLMVGMLVVASSAFAQDAILAGTDGDDVIIGTAAGESIYARAGNDVVNAGPGDDELDGGSGADVLNGGDGSDSVAYAGTASVYVALDGAANDGAVGERDNVGADVEDIFGGDGADKLVGGPAANTIDGGAGDDRIAGGAGQDALFGGDGDDVIDARDGQVDRVECGAGSDTATVDRNDVVSRDCETRSKPRVTLTPGLTFRTKEKRLLVSSIVARSRLVIACVTGCRPSAAPTKAILSSKSVTLNGGRVARFALPSRIAGATIEVGVTAPGASTTCVRYRVGKRFRTLKRVKGVACTTVARG